MNDAVLVRGFERFGDLTRDRQCVGERQALRAPMMRGQVVARRRAP